MEDDSELNNRLFTTVVKRKLKAKRKHSSPSNIEDWGIKLVAKAPKLTASPAVAASALARRVDAPLIGRSTTLKLNAAAAVKVPKAFFCISNVFNDFDTIDIINHLKSIKVRVLFCFDITSSSASAKAFKVAVPQSEVIKMSNADLWPSSVRIRLWRHSSAVRDERLPSQLGNLIDEGLQILRVINNNTVSTISPESMETLQAEVNNCDLQTDVATCSPIMCDNPTISSDNELSNILQTESGGSAPPSSVIVSVQVTP